MRKLEQRFSVVLILVLCLTLLMSSFVLAKNDTECQTFSMVANDDQLKILNDLYGKDISYGELVEKVYPAALERTPANVLKNMYKAKFEWPDVNSQSSSKTSNSSKRVNENFMIDVEADDMTPRIDVGVGNESNISIGENKIDYDSGSRVWLPYPTYTIPHMSVTSILVRDGYGAVASQYKSDSNCYGISASGTHYFPSEGRYQTQGFHYGEFPVGANPPNYMVSTNSRWVDYE